VTPCDKGTHHLIPPRLCLYESDLETPSHALGELIPSLDSCVGVATKKQTFPIRYAIIAITTQHDGERFLVATLIVRDIDEMTKAALRQRAARNGRSTEAEVRSILKESVKARSWVSVWLEQAASLRGDELPVPKRTAARNLSLFEDAPHGYR